MKKSFAKLTALCLAAAVAFGAAGCGKEKKETQQDKNAVAADDTKEDKKTEKAAFFPVEQKSAREDNTITDIRVLEEEESLAELARLLGSDALTEAALSNAREMRSQAQQSKAQR